ncbi:MFS transporter [Kineococcus sp. TBRC 1896]|uniref:MFS transporter n=1 Tax=Kineococcus mangrovi TaxID=1660183 RepID=A0ABV4I3Q3_9ACTN
MSSSRTSPAAAPVDGHPDAPVSAGPVVVVLALAGISVSLMQTLVIPIVQELPALLSTSASNASWGITATLLAAAVVTPISGRLGDMLGKRPVLLASLAVMVTGSVLCGLSESLAPFIVGRALQGFAAGVIPLGISLMRDVLPAEKVGPSTALMSASLGVGGALGLPAAALIADNLSWHWLFWVSAGLGAVVLVLVVLLIPAVRAQRSGTLDLLGALGLSVALVGILLGVSKGSTWGWSSGRTSALLIGGVLVALLWGVYQLRAKDPLVDLRTTATRPVLLTNVASLMFGFAMFAMSLVIPQVIQLPTTTGYGLGEPMLVAGLAMVPSGLVMMVTAGLSAKVTRDHGAKVSLMTGATVVALGYGLGAIFMDAVWQFAVVSGVIGAGIGFAYGSMPALIMSSVPVRTTASANSFNTLVRSIGSSVSSAVAGAVLAASATTLGTVSVPAQSGFRTIMVIASGAAVVALVIGALLPRRPQVPTAPAGAGPLPATPAQDVPVQDVPAVPGPRPRPTSTVSGTVSTDGARPLPGAVITVTDPAGGQVDRTSTDQDGRYSVQVPTGATYLLITAAPHLAPHAELVTVTEAPTRRDVALTGNCAITGRVLHGADAVEGVVVTLTDVTGRVVASSTTDHAGAYSFDALSGGSYVLTTRAGAHRPTARGVELAEDGVLGVDLSFPVGGRLTGTVTAGTARHPLAEATVTLLDEQGTVLERTTTDGAGTYAFDGLPTGRYTLTTSSHAPVTTGVTVQDSATGTHDVHLGAPAALDVVP